MKQALLALFIFACLPARDAVAAASDPVVLEDLGSQAKISNGKISFIV